MRHLRKDWDGIQDTNQGKDTVPYSSIQDDEPVFLLRAKDPAAAQAVYYWAEVVASQGGDPELTQRVSKWAREMTAWRQENYPAPKVADTPEGMLK